jgi:phage tail-like protein
VALGLRRDPYGAYNFLVELSGIVVAGFSEVTGLRVEIDVQEYREGGLNTHMHRLSGPARYPSNLVLRRGLTDSPELWAWHEAAVHGVGIRQHGSIVLLDDARNEVWRWFFLDALPVRWIGPELRASGSAVAVETLELAHHGLRGAP